MKYANRYQWCVNHEEYWQGLDARIEGFDIETNPHQKDTRKWICWRVGWFGA